MDKATVKLLLESYRPQEANDPLFAEALREVAADPELAAWFEEMQRFDAVMAAKFRAVVVPPEVKNHILLGYRGQTAPAAAHRRSALRWSGAAAAILVLALVGWQLLAPRRSAADALAQQAIAFTEQMPALQFVCFDAAVVAQWVNEQPGSRQLGFTLPKPGEGLSMAMIGSSIVEWNGRPVVMICLQDKKRMAMLYILNPGDATQLKEGASETVQKDGWAVRTSRADGRVRVLATKGRRGGFGFSHAFLKRRPEVKRSVILSGVLPRKGGGRNAAKDLAIYR